MSLDRGTAAAGGGELRAAGAAAANGQTRSLYAQPAGDDGGRFGAWGLA